MHAILAHDGNDPTAFDAVVRVARDHGAPIEFPGSNLAVIGRAPSLAASGSAIFFGSAALAASATHTSADSLLDRAPDDVVSCAFDHGALTIAANRGNHRLFVHDSNGSRTVCSSLALLARATNAAIDRSREDFVLGFGFYPGTSTPYVGIESIAPGERLRGATSASTLPPESGKPQTVDSFDGAIPQLREVFLNALETQAAGRRRHAVLLGGFDSMLVAASLRELGHEVHTYTFAFGDSRYEQRNIPEFVRRFGIEHHPVPIHPDTVASSLESFGEIFYQPGAQAHYQIFTLIASRQIHADGHDHIFNGDGCDAVFLSYPTVNRRAALNRRLSAIPEPLVNLTLSALRTRSAEYRLGHVARTMRSMLENLLLEEPARGHLPTCYLDNAALRRLRRGVAPDQVESVTQTRMRLAAAVIGHDGARRAFHGNGLTGQSRAKVDGAVYDTGLPHFSPYLDPTLKNFVSSLPIDYLKRQDESPAANGKELLVAMVRRYGMLPENLVSQPKQSPVDSPVDGWYQHEIRERVEALLSELPFSPDSAYVDRLFRPKFAEQWYRNKVSIGHHTMQAVGLLASYASFNRSPGR